MRNLKKFLAVVLALAMTFSLMVSASAAFTDADKIDSEYAVSVEVLNGLGVFKGYNDGSFNPQGDITRAEVAAIIYRITTGDVEDKQAALYAGSAKFADVPTNEWYAGYVGFCANAGFVNGYEDGTFRPTGKVTGFEALAMVLRAIGYDAQNEFSGAKWQDNIAWVANNREITKDVKPGVLNGYASRELVAELLFETLMVEAVAYTPAFGYRQTGSSLGYKVFDLVEIEGVITANEYADLYASEPLSAGKTELDGKVYNLTSGLAALGMNHVGYAAGKDILYIEASGNDVWENAGAATTKTIKKHSGMDTAGAETYVNFDGEHGAYESDYRIEYVYEGEKTLYEAAELKYENGGTLTITGTVPTEAEWNDGDNEIDDETDIAITYTKTIRAGGEITDFDMDLMNEIFAEADETEGEVYVGTSSINNQDDVSDELSWKEFKAKYLNDDILYASVSGAKNGEWLKVIDNDEDGDADYIFKTEFAMSEIVDISKKDVYTFAALVEDADIELDEIDGEDIITADELAEGDIVIYAYIDGNYYVDLAEVKTETIDKKGIDYRDETFTVDGVEYGMSGIFHADVAECDIDEMEAAETYNLYLDKFGYVRLFAEPTYDKGFVLLTDGYYKTDKRDDVFQATVWDAETEALVDVDVVDSWTKLNGNYPYTAENFIDVEEGGDNGNRGTWKRLLEVDEVYAGFAKTAYLTNIAGYTVDEDGYTLIDIEEPTAISNRTEYDVAEITVTDKTKLSAKTLTGDAGTVQTTTSTVYYLVVKNNAQSKINSIITWVGYNNVPEEAELGAWDKTYAYAVTTDGDKDQYNRYDVAEIVVFETIADIDDALFFTYDYAGKVSDPHTAYAIGYNTEAEAYGDMSVSIDESEGEALDLIEFAYIWDNGKIDNIEENYAAEYIYAGYAWTAADVNDRDYLKVAVDEAEDSFLTYKPASVDSFVVYQNSKGVYSVDVQELDYEQNDRLILVCDDEDNVLYVINVEQSLDYDDDRMAEVDALWAKIWAEQNTVEAPAVVNTLYSVKVLGEEIEATEADPFTYVAYVCEEEVTGTAPRLEVVDNYAGAEMELWNKTKTEKIGDKTGIGSIADEGDTVSAQTEWIVVSGGVEYTVKVVILNHETALTSVDDTKAIVTYDVIQIASTYANENSLTENALKAVLNVPATAELDFDADDFTVIVSAECGHVAEYVVVFVEYPFSASAVASANALRAAIAAAEDDEVIQLVADIELTEEWTPMDFSATFDGNGHTISGLEIDTDEAGFFANLADGAVIKNVIFEEVEVTGKYAAIVAYYADAATIENVQVSGSVNATSYAAGIVFEGSGTVIKDCVNDATIDAGYSASGIGGWILDNATVDGCENNGDVTGGNRAGGICGNFAGTMTNCVNNGDVVSNGSGAAGGMIGIASAATTIENCTNNGDVTTTADNDNASAAGILGQNPGSKAITIKSCVNNGDITAENSHAAGIAVSLYGKITANGCSNTGTIQGKDGAADIVAPKGIFGGSNTVTE